MPDSQHFNNLITEMDLKGKSRYWCFLNAPFPEPVCIHNTDACSCDLNSNQYYLIPFIILVKKATILDHKSIFIQRLTNMSNALGSYVIEAKVLLN